MQNLQEEEGVDTTDSNDVSKLSADNRSVHYNTSTSSRNQRSGNINRRNQERNQCNYKPRTAWSQHFQQMETYISVTLVTYNIVNNQSGKFGYLKDAIILDTGSTIPATFMNTDLVTNIKVSKKPITMQTNA